MKLRKLLAVTAVAATMTAAFAVNAMAEETLKLTAEEISYDAKTGVITLTTDKHPSAAPYTMLVVVNDEKPLETTGEIPSDTSFDDGDIKQIDQADAAFTKINVGDLTAVSNCAECTANKAEKCSHTRTYEIRLGGDGNVRWGTLTIEPESSDPENPYANSTRLLGDVDGNTEIDVVDVGLVVRASAGLETLTGESLQAADADCNTEVDVVDVGVIVRYSAGLDSSVIDGKKTVADRTTYVPENN